MAKRPKKYKIVVHYPKSEEKMTELRNNMGCTYIKFLKEYILSLSISDDEKNNLYREVVEELLSKYQHGKSEMKVPS